MSKSTTVGNAGSSTFRPGKRGVFDVPPRPGRDLRRSALPGSAFVLVAVVTVALRLPSLLEPHHYTDEGIFAAVAQRLLQGHPLYSGAWDNKPPLVYWLYAGVMALLGPSMVALHTLAALWAAASAVGVAVLGRRWLGPRTGTAAGLLFGVLISLPFVEGNLALTELFAVGPSVWAFVLLTARPATARRAAVAGMLFAAAALFKQVAALDAVAALVYLALAGGDGWRRAAALVGGAAATAGTVAAVLAVQGSLPAAVFAVAGFYAVYLHEGSALPPVFGLLKMLPPLAAVSAALIAAPRGRLGPAHLLALWLGFAALGATMAARPFGHYAVQALAPAALTLAALGGSIRWWTRPRLGAAPPTPAILPPARALGLVLTAALAVYTITVAFNGFWFSYGVVGPAYYGETARYLAGRESRASFDRFFSWRVANQDQLAAIIRADSDRTLFVWGEYPWLYPLADAENPTRYETSYLTSFVPGAKDEVMAALWRTPPRYIVWERGEWRRLPGLGDLLAARYERVAVVDNSDLYRRVDTPVNARRATPLPPAG